MEKRKETVLLPSFHPPQKVPSETIVCLNGNRHQFLPVSVLLGLLLKITRRVPPTLPNSAKGFGCFWPLPFFSALACWTRSTIPSTHRAFCSGRSTIFLPLPPGPAMLISDQLCLLPGRLPGRFESEVEGLDGERGGTGGLLGVVVLVRVRGSAFSFSGPPKCSSVGIGGDGE